MSDTHFQRNEERESYFAASISYTTRFNMTGNPVVVLPVGRSREGLPIGIQVVGRRWKDMELLAVAEALTEVTKPFQRPPEY
jgi:amidase